MALTISNKVYTVWGNKRAVIFDMDFGSSYPSDGETLAPETVGLSLAEQVIVSGRKGYDFEYDIANQKMKTFAPAPPIVFEEVVTTTSHVGTLQYPAAYIMYVGVANEGFKVIPGNLTPVAKTVAVSNAEDGVRPTLTFLPGDNVTTCYVTYITQAWKEVYDNLVYAKLAGGVRVTGHADLTFAPGTPDVIDLGELAIGVQNVTWVDNGTVKKVQALYIGETAATVEATIDFSAPSGNTNLSVLQSDTWDVADDDVYITYIRKPASGFLFDRFVEENDLTPSGDVVTISSGGVESNLLLYGTCGDFPGPTTKFANIIRSGGAVSTTATLIQATKLNTHANIFTLGSGHEDTVHLKPSYLYGSQADIPGVVPLETRNGTDLSGLTGCKVIMIGR